MGVLCVLEYPASEWQWGIESGVVVGLSAFGVMFNGNFNFEFKLTHHTPPTPGFWFGLLMMLMRRAHLALALCICGLHMPT